MQDADRRSAVSAPCDFHSWTRFRPWNPSSGSARASELPDQRLGAPLDQLVGDDLALDLARALPDPVDADLAPEPLRDVLAHVPPAAEDLHGAVGDAPGRLAREELRHRALRMLDLDVGTRVDVLGQP